MVRDFGSELSGEWVVKVVKKGVGSWWFDNDLEVELALRQASPPAKRKQGMLIGQWDGLVIHQLHLRKCTQIQQPATKSALEKHVFCNARAALDILSAC